MPFGPVLLRNDALQLCLNLCRRRSVLCKTDPVGYTKDVRVNWQRVDPESNGCYNLGGLASYSRQSDEFVHGRRHVASEFVDNHSRHSHEVTRLVVWIRAGADERIDILRLCGGQRLRVRELAKQCGCDLIHPLVRTLSGQDNCCDQLVWSPVVEFGLGLWNGDAERLNGLLRSVLACHSGIK